MMNERILIDLLLKEINNWRVDPKKNDVVNPDFINVAKLLKEYLDESHIDIENIDYNTLWQRHKINKLLNMIDDPYYMGAIFDLIQSIHNKYSNDICLLNNKVSMIIDKIEDDKNSEEFILHD